MAASLTFWAGINQIQNTNGSGLGFYGSTGFGAPVSVNTYQDTTYITNGAGTSLGPQANNIKYTNAGSGYVNGASSGISLTAIPNYQASVNVHFHFDSNVQVQNAEARIYDRSDINQGATGVLTKVAELIHPTTTQVNNGSGDAAWITPAGSSVTVTLANSPGVSGFYAGNGVSSALSTTDHDWYLAISANPDSIGSKTLFGLFIQLEYF